MIWSRTIFGSRNEDNSYHESKKMRVIKTNYIKTNNNILSDHIDAIDYIKIIKGNIEYDILSQNCENKELLDSIINLVVEVLYSTKTKIYINSEPKPIEVVKSQLLKLTSEHIIYTINCIKNNVKTVRRINSYILTTLYNSVNTYSIDVELQVAKLTNNRRD